MVLVPENNIERLQKRQQILTPPVTQTLKNLDSEMGDILSSNQLDDKEKAKGQPSSREVNNSQACGNAQTR